jgi:hypothetical protein
MYQDGPKIYLETDQEAKRVPLTYALHVGDESVRNATELIDAFGGAEAGTNQYPLELSERTARQVRWALQRERRLEGEGTHEAGRRIIAHASLKMLDLPVQS